MYDKEEIENEVWKDIKNFEGLYQVSNLGRVKSFIGKAPKILTNGKNKSYVTKTLCSKETRVIKSVHRIVLETFVGESDLDVDHINGIKNDNRLSNLRYVTHRENIKYYVERTKKVGYYFSKFRNKWISSIVIEGFKYSLGYKNTKEEAISAYNSALEDWLLKNLKPYNSEKRSKNKNVGVYFVEGIKKYSVYFQRNNSNIFLGYYEKEQEAVDVYNNSIKEWETNSVIPFYINPKKTSICKFIHYNKKSNKWIIKVSGKECGKFDSEKEAVKVLFNYAEEKVFTDLHKDKIKKYISNLTDEQLNLIKYLI